MTSDSPQPDMPKGRIARLLDDLDSKEEGVRTTAEREIQDMGPDGLRALLAYARQEQRRLNRQSTLSALLLLAFMTAGMIIRNLLDRLDAVLQVAYLLAMMLAFFLAGYMVIRMAVQSLSVYKKVSRVVEKVDDIRAVGPVLETLVTSPFSSDTTPPATFDFLTRMLPCLKASDAHLLNEEQRRQLYEALDSYTGPGYEFPLAVLQAIEQVGDEQARPFVARRAHGKVAAPDEKRVQEAAQACLSVLNARIEQQRVQQTLLRPSEAPSQHGATLLRPAQGSSDADPHRLVRPAAPDEEDHPS